MLCNHQRASFCLNYASKSKHGWFEWWRIAIVLNGQLKKHNNLFNKSFLRLCIMVLLPGHVRSNQGESATLRSGAGELHHMVDQSLDDIDEMVEFWLCSIVSESLHFSNCGRYVFFSFFINSKTNNISWYLDIISHFYREPQEPNHWKSQRPRLSVMPCETRPKPSMKRVWSPCVGGGKLTRWRKLVPGWFCFQNCWIFFCQNNWCSKFWIFFLEKNPEISRDLANWRSISLVLRVFRNVLPKIPVAFQPLGKQLLDAFGSF